MTGVSESLQTPHSFSSKVKVCLKSIMDYSVCWNNGRTPPPKKKSKKYQHLKIKLFRLSLKCFLYKRREGEGRLWVNCQRFYLLLFLSILVATTVCLCINWSVKIAKNFLELIVLLCQFLQSLEFKNVYITSLFLYSHAFWFLQPSLER